MRQQTLRFVLCRLRTLIARRCILEHALCIRTTLPDSLLLNFARLLTLFPGLDADGKAVVRTRLLDYFEIVGAEDERTITARRAFTNLLY